MKSVPAQIGPYLEPNAADAYFQLNAAFKSRFGKALAITEAYRDYDRQVYLANGGTTNEAAAPGTSIHGWGRACDFGAGVNVGGSTEKVWMNANAPDYGWSPRGDSFKMYEPWHFEYDGAGAAAPSSPSTTNVRNKMIILRSSQVLNEASAGYTALVGIRTLRHLSTGDQVDNCKSVGIPYYSVDRATFYDVINALSIPRAAITTGADYAR
ncbi:M15 family metallopeptidase [Curtobacterium sp. RRHDQ66]|uniref:M15 family metallopeptidase n=1 Tax=Curtobacterium guangdongense TaxID=3413380 RepID=UPI003BF0575C